MELHFAGFLLHQKIGKKGNKRLTQRDVLITSIELGDFIVGFCYLNHKKYSLEKWGFAAVIEPFRKSHTHYYKRKEP